MRQGGGGGEDVGVFGQFDNGRRAAAVFFDFVRGGVFYGVVGHGGHGDEDVVVGGACHDFAVHVLRAGGGDGFVQGGGQGGLHQAVHEGNARASGTAGAGECRAHFAAGQVGDAAHWVDGLEGGTGGDEHVFAAQGFFRPQIGQQFGQCGGLGHAPFAGFAAGQVAAFGREDGDAVGGELGDVALVGRIAPHVHVHGGRGGQRAGAGGGEVGEQVVGNAVRDFGEGVGGGGGDEEGVGFAGEADVRHAVGSRAVVGFAQNVVAAEGLEGEWGDEFGSGAAHGDAHFVPLFF